jgi:hypothetical protein
MDASALASDRERRSVIPAIFIVRSAGHCHLQRVATLQRLSTFDLRLLVTPAFDPAICLVPTELCLRGSMDELIARLVADVGIERATAEKAVGIILDFLVKEGPADKVQPLLAKLPGAEAVMQRAATENEAGGTMPGGMGGAMAGTMGGVMGAGMRMMSAGLSMGQVQSVTRAVIAYTREKAGEDAVGEIVAAIPGLAQFV